MTLLLWYQLVLGILRQQSQPGYQSGLKVVRRFWPDNSGPWWNYNGRSFSGRCSNHMDIHDVQNDNILPLVYILEISLNLNEFNPKYPKNPRNLGEKIRKARMDKGLFIRELASELGVTEDTVINWEIRNIKPEGKNLDRVREFIEV